MAAVRCGQAARGARRSNSISYTRYLKQLLTIVLSSSLALGLVCALWLLFAGGSSAEIDVDIEFGRFDGLWFLLGLPLVLTFLLLLVSPLAWGIHRLLFRRREAQDR